MSEFPVAESEQLDRALLILADGQRRAVLRALAEGGSVAPGAVPRPAGAGAERHRGMLHHVHLPKLAEAGYITWSPGDDEISPGARFEEAMKLLRTLPREVQTAGE